jgi:enoyl-CoA hydratase/carnithine racemase
MVHTELRNRVEVITINRPESRNAIDDATSKALADTFDAAEANSAVWAMVLTGAGDKAFSVGMDLKAFAGGGGNVMGVSGGCAGITRRDFPKPLIAAVNGHALAGGLEIMLACDLVGAADHATFGLPEV